MMTLPAQLTQRERELGAIIRAYNEVTERLKHSHDRLLGEVQRLREQIESKNRELARRERLAALGQMAAGVAHEIRNPLAGIRLYATLLEKDLSDRSDACRLARRIGDGVATLDRVVGDVLDFARQAEPRRQPIELALLVQRCIELARPRYAAEGAPVEVVVPEAMVVRADGDQLQRALLNLLLNAMDAAGAEGQVRVTASTDAADRAVRLAVSDTGPGVPAAQREEIFNPFFTTKHSGTGLGLAIVHRIVEAHGGTIEVDDVPGGGACFTVTLPQDGGAAAEGIS